MTGDQWLDVLIGIAVALLLILLLLIAVIVIRRPKGKLVAAYRRFSSSDAVPGRNLWRRLLVLSVLVILNVICLGLLLSRAPGEQVVEPATTQSATPGGLSSSAGPSQASGTRPTTSTTPPGAGDNTGSGSSEQKTIQLEAPAESARPFQTVRIQGTYQWWCRHPFAGAALGRRQMGGLPVTD